MPSLRHVDVKDKVAELAVEHPAWEDFVRLGRLTKLRRLPDGRFAEVNFESGLLLYALAMKYRPRSVLEIGTGRGFGALCLATALRDLGGEGRVVTVDVNSYEQPIDWAIDDGTGPRVASLSMKDVWERHVDAAVRGLVEPRSGPSVEVLRALRAEGFRADLVYIDGDHTYPGVRHDLYASLLVSARPFRMLIDDYTPGSDVFGVRRLVDEDLAPVFEAEAIHTEGRWEGGELCGEPLSQSFSAHVWIDSERTRQPIDPLLARAAGIVERHRRWGGALRGWDRATRALRRRLGGLGVRASGG
jgi:hypothetical protein